MKLFFSTSTGTKNTDSNSDTIAFTTKNTNSYVYVIISSAKAVKTTQQRIWKSNLLERI